MSAPAYGLDADLAAKQAAHYDHDLEKAVTTWIGEIIGETMDGTVQDWLHDGQRLCKLVNTIKPGSIKKVNTSAMVFKQRENITYFQNFAREHGVPEISMFGTDDLFDNKNMGSVMTAMHMFGGVIQVTIPEYTGPKLGEPVNAKVKDGKRAGGVATQSGGLTGVMQVQNMNQGRREVAGGTNTGVSAPTGATDAMGLDRDLAAKKDASYDHALVCEVVAWIESISGETCPGSEKGQAQSWLKSGQVLCRLVNKVQPGKIASINTMATPFKERENITYFQGAMRDMGVPESQLFGTDDLYDDKNIMNFIKSATQFGGALQKSHPQLPKLGASVSHEMADGKRHSAGPVSQMEAMQRNMEVERPKNTGITSGADAGR